MRQPRSSAPVVSGLVLFGGLMLLSIWMHQGTGELAKVGLSVLVLPFAFLSGIAYRRIVLHNLVPTGPFPVLSYAWLALPATVATWFLAGELASRWPFGEDAAGGGSFYAWFFIVALSFMVLMAVVAGLLQGQGYLDPSLLKAEAARLADSAYDDVEKGNMQAARTKLEKALQLAPDLACAHSEYALVLKAYGEHQRARNHIEQALLLEPQEPKYWAALSRWYLDCEQLREALGCILVAEKLDPEYPAVQSAKSEIAAKLSAPQEVIDYYKQKALKLYEMRGHRADGTPLKPGDLETFLS